MTAWDDDYDAADDYDSDYDDGYDDDETATVICSQCRAEVYEDAPQCPECGAYVTRSTSPLAGMPRWVVVFGVIGMLLTAFALAMG